MREKVAIIGGGPAGLMAAEVLLDSGCPVELFDRMPSIGRKFLMAGKGGLNLTHSEQMDQLLTRYGNRKEFLAPIIQAFPPEYLRRWINQLGFNTFIGTSGRIFPENFNSVPILKAWIARLKSQGLVIHTRHNWIGWEGNYTLHFETPVGLKIYEASAVIMALGGGSWPQLGSDGAWVSVFTQKGIDTQPLIPSNCGFDVAWTPHFIERFNGTPVKSVLVKFRDGEGNDFQRKGEFIITKTGVEGSVIYALSSFLRDEIMVRGAAFIDLDLAPDWTFERLLASLARPRGSKSVSSYLKKAVGITGVKAGLLWETLEREDFDDPERLASAIKGTRLTLLSPRPLEEAISSAGGVEFDALNHNLMLKKFPGVFCAGEMLDWEAPTGGYLLTACFAMGRWAGNGVLSWLNQQVPEKPA